MADYFPAHQTGGSRRTVALAKWRVLEIGDRLVAKDWAPPYNDLIKQFAESFR